MFNDKSTVNSFWNGKETKNLFRSYYKDTAETVTVSDLVFSSDPALEVYLYLKHSQEIPLAPVDDGTPKTAADHQTYLNANPYKYEALVEGEHYVTSKEINRLESSTNSFNIFGEDMNEYK